jgi:polyribonucleotide 5'-hydroxyl-kinase
LFIYKVLIVGPSDHGKSSIARILSSYAVRLDRTPIYVDLDVSQGSISIPGCVCAAPLDKTNINIEDGFSLPMPLVYYHGHTRPKENVDLYKVLLTTLADKVNSRLEKDLEARSSGVIINTSGWIDDGGFDVLLYCIKVFAIDIILVMGNDKLYSSLSSTVGSTHTIVKLPRSGGVVMRVS